MKASAPSAIELTIDGRSLQASPGQSILEVAQAQGINIPTLCYLKECGAITSCLVCLVKVKTNGPARMVPSCATKVQPGMVIESETAEVHEARRTALELLLGDHVGDCLSPCQRICPLQMNIPLMLRQVQGGHVQEAIATVRSALPLPGVLGYLCSHPCENGCRRATYDQPAAIRDLERFVAETDLRSERPYQPLSLPASGKSVVVVGAGPTGLSAAYFLLRSGHAVTLIDRNQQAGGTLRDAVREQQLPASVLTGEVGVLERLGARLQLGSELGKDVSLETLVAQYHAVVLAIGNLAKAEIQAWGLRPGADGIAVHSQTYQTDHPGVFAAGSAVKKVPALVRAMSEGQIVAQIVHQFLLGREIHRAEKPFSSVMGRLGDGELNLFMRGPNPTAQVKAADPAGYNQKEAACEASRCLHCDCRAAGHCTLQRYAALYHADARRFQVQRPSFQQYRQSCGVIFEPGKCILCGICVKLTEQAREPLGLTFIGRGFDVRIGAPLKHSIADGLRTVARQCVEHCPTGALAWGESELRSTS